MEPQIDKYEYNRFDSKGKRVGQASLDILGKDNNPTVYAGEIIDASAEKYRDQMQEAVDTGAKLYESPFYVFVITKKDMHMINVVRSWFTPRQTAPFASKMMEDYPYATKTLYMVDVKKGAFKVCWSLPGLNECVMIASAPEKNNPELVQWVFDFFQNKLDKENYSFDQ